MINDFPKFRFWCYKVLPLVYDDSLSYYEVLCKVVKYIEGLIEQDKVFADEIESIESELEYVKHWIDTFDTEVAEIIIREALNNITSVTFTSFILDDEDAATVLNAAVANGCKTICVDADIDLTAPVYLASGVEVKGMGGKINCSASGAGLRSWGESGTLIATANNVAEGNTQLTLASGSGIEAGKRYFIKGTENLFNREDEYSLGQGTSGAATVYGGIEFVARSVSGSTIVMDRQIPHYIGSAEIYTVKDIEDVVIRDIDITGKDHLIYFRYANNCCVDNCNVTCESNYPVYMIYGYECNITNCSIKELADDSFNKNPIVLSSCGECTIDNNVISGGYQGIDITYGDTYSYYNVISNNTVNYASTGSFTTHPAAFKNIITGNIFTGKMQIRCYGNVITNNIIGHHLYLSGNRIDGTIIEGNVFKHATPIQLTYHGDTESVSYVDRVYIKNNVCPSCTMIVAGVNEGKTLALYISGNTLKASGNTAYLLTIGTSELYELHITHNILVGYKTLKVFGGDGNAVTCMRFKFEHNSIEADTPSFNVQDGSITGNVEFNDVNFGDGITALYSNRFGADYPSNPMKGQTFLKNDGTYAIYDGSAWKVITTT